MLKIRITLAHACSRGRLEIVRASQAAGPLRCEDYTTQHPRIGIFFQRGEPATNERAQKLKRDADIMDLSHFGFLIFQFARRGDLCSFRRKGLGTDKGLNSFALPSAKSFKSTHNRCLL